MSGSGPLVIGLGTGLGPVVAFTARELWRSALIPITEGRVLDGRERTTGEWRDVQGRLIAVVDGGDWPDTPQVYVHLNHKRKVVYVGQAVDLKDRFADHAKTVRARDLQWTSWVSYECDRTELNTVERTLIRLYRPKGNIIRYTNWKETTAA